MIPDIGVGATGAEGTAAPQLEPRGQAGAAPTNVHLRIIFTNLLKFLKMLNSLMNSPLSIVLFQERSHIKNISDWRAPTRITEASDQNAPSQLTGALLIRWRPHDSPACFCLEGTLPTFWRTSSQKAPSRLTSVFMIRSSSPDLLACF